MSNLGKLNKNKKRRIHKKSWNTFLGTLFLDQGSIKPQASMLSHRTTLNYSVLVRLEDVWCVQKLKYTLKYYLPKSNLFQMQLI